MTHGHHSWATCDSLPRIISTQCAIHKLQSNFTQITSNFSGKSRYFPQRDLFPGPISFQTLAIFTVVKKAFVLFLKKKKKKENKFSAFKPNASNAFTQNYQKNVYLEQIPNMKKPATHCLKLHTLKKKVRNIYQQDWKNTWKHNLFIILTRRMKMLWQTPTNTQMHVQISSGLGLNVFFASVL